ncbi:hypothetical protein NQ315_005785, partial [Exocentrus adspersus]
RLECRAITGAISSKPSAALEILRDLLPLRIYLEREARWVTYRNKQMAINLPQTNIMEHNRMLVEGMESHSVLGMVSDGLPARINLDLPYNIFFPRRDEWERNRTDLLRADICWYTNGSKTPGGAEAGAEIHAIELCGKIFCDSRAALGSHLGSYHCTPKALWNCQQTLSRVGGTNRLILVWIPGHIGLRGNEVEDYLARRGAASGFYPIQSKYHEDLSLMDGYIFILYRFIKHREIKPDTLLNIENFKETAK